MCKLLIGVQLQPESKKFRDMVQLQAPSIGDMPDGLGAMLVSQENKYLIDRTLEQEGYEAVFKRVSAEIASSKIVAIHGRQSTSGTTSLLNVHFFERKGFAFAHNGVLWGRKKTVWDTSTTPKKKVESDIRGFESTDIPNNVDDYIASRSPERQIANRLKDEEIHQFNIIQTQINFCYDRETGCMFSEDGGLCPTHEQSIGETLDTLLEKAGLETADVILLTSSLDFKLVEEYREENTVQKKKDEEKDKTTSVMPYKPEGYEPCDSLEFFEDLPLTAKLNCKKLKEIADDRRFSGIALLTDMKRNRAFVIATRDVKVQTDGKDYLFLYSYEPVDTIMKRHSVCGLDIWYEDEGRKIPTAELAEGVYEFQWGKKQGGIPTLVEQEV